MVGIEVSRYYNFVTLERSFSKLDSNSMSKCWLYLVAAGVGLDEVMVLLHTVSLVVHFTGIFELLIGCGQRTVESRHIFFAFDLVIAADVLETFLTAATAFCTDSCDRRHYFTSRNS